MSHSQNNIPVYKSNALIEASYRLTPAEQRIMYIGISKVRRNEEVTDQELYSINVADYVALVGTDSGSVYQELEAASLRLKRREVWIHERPNGGGKHDKTLVTSWVQSIVYHKAEGRIELRFTHDMLPYLSQLTEQFTRCALKDIAKMTSGHAIRLHELLNQWRSTGKREVSIEWLREAFMLGEKYPLLYDFKKRVIVPAVEQINKHSPLWVKWEQRKTGRRVSHLVFTFGEKVENKSKPKTGKAKKQLGKGALYGISRARIEANARPGEEYEDVALRILEKNRQARGA